VWYGHQKLSRTVRVSKIEGERGFSDLAKVEHHQNACKKEQRVEGQPPPKKGQG